MFYLKIPKHLLDIVSPCFHSALKKQRADMNISILFCWLSFTLFLLYYFVLNRRTKWLEKAAKKGRKLRRAMVINSYRRTICAGLCCFFVSRELKFNQGTPCLTAAGRDSVEFRPPGRHLCDNSTSPSFCA